MNLIENECTLIVYYSGVATRYLLNGKDPKKPKIGLKIHLSNDSDESDTLDLCHFIKSL